MQKLDAGRMLLYQEDTISQQMYDVKKGSRKGCAIIIIFREEEDSLQVYVWWIINSNATDHEYLNSN